MLENIEIVDYKCFKDFKLDGLSRINIISGGNNVGKTALLEALLLIKNSSNIRSFIQVIKFIFENRDLNKEDIERYLETINLSFKYNEINITIKHKYLEELGTDEINEAERYRNEYEEFLIIKIDNVLQIIPFFRISHSSMARKENVDITFINSSKPNNSELTKLYSSVQDLEVQDKFLNYLQIIDPNIIGIEPQLRGKDKSFLRISLVNPKQSLLSSELGEGTNRFIEILASLLKSSNGTVFIDEIENGIHNLKLKNIWKAIIEIVKKEEIQLFVTTHDSDTIEALVDASKEKDYKDITSIRLIKDNQNKIQPIIMNYENLLFGTDIGEDFR